MQAAQLAQAAHPLKAGIHASTVARGTPSLGTTGQGAREAYARRFDQCQDTHTVPTTAGLLALLPPLPLPPSRHCCGAAAVAARSRRPQIGPCPVTHPDSMLQTPPHRQLPRRLRMRAEASRAMGEVGTVLTVGSNSLHAAQAAR